MPGCLMLDSLDDGAFCTESCPRLRATMATARNLLRVPRLGLLAFCLFSRSSALRLLMLCSEHTKETCMVPRCRAAGSLLPGAQPHAPPGAARRGPGLAGLAGRASPRRAAPEVRGSSGARLPEAEGKLRVLRASDASGGAASLRPGCSRTADAWSP